MQGINKYILKTNLSPVCKAHSPNAFNDVYIANDGLRNFIAKETILACNQPAYNAKAIILSASYEKGCVRQDFSFLFL